MQLVPWRSLSSAGLVVACASSALAGGYLAVSAFATTVEPFSLGTVAAGATPVIDGRVDVYVPIVDWGVRASPYDAPVAIELRFRSLDRNQALGALRSGAVARARLDVMRAELAEIGRASLQRSAILGLAGGIAGGLLGGAVVGAALHRRTWLAYGAAAGFLAPVAFVAVILATLRDIDYSAFEQPTFYAHGRELPRLLSFSGQLLTASESYTESYEQALAGLANLVGSRAKAELRQPRRPRSWSRLTCMRTASSSLARRVHAREDRPLRRRLHPPRNAGGGPPRAAGACRL